MPNSYAIVETGGKQYRAEKGESLVVERLPAEAGSKVTLRAVMFKGDKDVVLESGELEKVKVEAVVTEHLRGPKVRIFKYKAKKGYRRRGGHRQGLTKLEVTDVRMLTRKPAAASKPQAEKKDEPEDKAATKPAAEAKPKAPAKKPAAKPAAKKPAAKKPAKKAAKKAAGKPGAKKKGTKKAAKKKTSARRRR